MGTRTIIAIKLTNDKGESRDLQDLKGPPYSVVEYVFDAFELVGTVIEEK